MEQITREEMIGLLREHQQLLVRHGHPLIEVIRAENAITALQAAEPVAVLCQQIDAEAQRQETSWFEHEPLHPKSRLHKHRSESKGWETLEVFALPCPPAKSQPKPVVGSVGYFSRGDALWLAYCPENGPEFFIDKASAEAKAAELIHAWRDDDGGWLEEAGQVFVAQITSQSDECDVVQRPPDDQLDEDGFDDDGNWWDDNWDRICNFKLQPVDVETNKAQVPDALREIAGWMEDGGPTWHEAEMIGMEVSGAVGVSSAKRCTEAARRAFLEAARIWEYMHRDEMLTASPAPDRNADADKHQQEEAER